MSFVQPDLADYLLSFQDNCDTYNYDLIDPEVYSLSVYDSVIESNTNESSTNEEDTGKIADSKQSKKKTRTPKNKAYNPKQLNSKSTKSKVNRKRQANISKPKAINPKRQKVSQSTTNQTKSVHEFFSNESILKLLEYQESNKVCKGTPIPAHQDKETLNSTGHTDFERQSFESGVQMNNEWNNTCLVEVDDEELSEQSNPDVDSDNESFTDDQLALIETVTGISHYSSFDKCSKALSDNTSQPKVDSVLIESGPTHSTKNTNSLTLEQEQNKDTTIAVPNSADDCTVGNVIQTSQSVNNDVLLSSEALSSCEPSSTTEDQETLLVQEIEHQQEGEKQEDTAVTSLSVKTASDAEVSIEYKKALQICMVGNEIMQDSDCETKSIKSLDSEDINQFERNKVLTSTPIHTTSTINTKDINTSSEADSPPRLNIYECPTKQISKHAIDYLMEMDEDDVDDAIENMLSSRFPSVDAFSSILLPCQSSIHASNRENNVYSSDNNDQLDSSRDTISSASLCASNREDNDCSSDNGEQQDGYGDVILEPVDVGEVTVDSDVTDLAEGDCPFLPPKRMAIVTEEQISSDSITKDSNDSISKLTSKTPPLNSKNVCKTSLSKIRQPVQSKKDRTAKPNNIKKKKTVATSITKVMNGLTLSTTKKTVVMTEFKKQQLLSKYVNNGQEMQLVIPLLQIKLKKKTNFKVLSMNTVTSNRQTPSNFQKISNCKSTNCKKDNTLQNNVTENLNQTVEYNAREEEGTDSISTTSKDDDNTEQNATNKESTQITKPNLKRWDNVNGAKDNDDAAKHEGTTGSGPKNVNCEPTKDQAQQNTIDSYINSNAQSDSEASIDKSSPSFITKHCDSSLSSGTNSISASQPVVNCIPSDSEYCEPEQSPDTSQQSNKCVPRETESVHVKGNSSSGKDDQPTIISDDNVMQTLSNCTESQSCTSQGDKNYQSEELDKDLDFSEDNCSETINTEQTTFKGNSHSTINIETSDELSDDDCTVARSSAKEQAQNVLEQALSDKPLGEINNDALPKVQEIDEETVLKSVSDESCDRTPGKCTLNEDLLKDTASQDNKQIEEVSSHTLSKYKGHLQVQSNTTGDSSGYVSINSCEDTCLQEKGQLEQESVPMSTTRCEDTTDGVLVDSFTCLQEKGQLQEESTFVYLNNDTVINRCSDTSVQEMGQLEEQSIERSTISRDNEPEHRITTVDVNSDILNNNCSDTSVQKMGLLEQEPIGMATRGDNNKSIQSNTADLSIDVLVDSDDALFQEKEKTEEQSLPISTKNDGKSGQCRENVDLEASSAYFFDSDKCKLLQEKKEHQKFLQTTNNANDDTLIQSTSVVDLSTNSLSNTYSKKSTNETKRKNRKRKSGKLKAPMANIANESQDDVGEVRKPKRRMKEKAIKYYKDTIKQLKRENEQIKQKSILFDWTSSFNDEIRHLKKSIETLQKKNEEQESIIHRQESHLHQLEQKLSLLGDQNSSLRSSTKRHFSEERQDATITSSDSNDYH